MTTPLFPLFTDSALSRRSFLSGSASLAAAVLAHSQARGAVTSSPNFSAYPFSLGVASGDPAPDGFVLWTRLAPKPLEGGGMTPVPVEVSWMVAEDEAMTKVAAKGATTATPQWAHSVHIEVEGLKPDRWYWYQFKVGGETSPKGRTRTLPPADASPASLKFAFASCQHFESGHYTAYEHMLRENLDLVVHLGDYIYEGAGRDQSVRKHLGPEITTLADYRNRHAQYKTDPALQAMHAATPWLVTWDDHEFDNNCANDISEQADVSPGEFLLRRAAAYQAYYEHMPLRRAAIPRGPDMLLYRRVAFGRLANFFVLDTRQYRSDQPCGDGNKPPCPEALAPDATLMGAAQREWLFNGLVSSATRWNVLAQQIMMGRVDRKNGPEEGYSMDQWPGYEMERRRVLNFFRERAVSNPVVLTGDIHSNWANELITDFDGLDGRSVATEFVGTSISSGGDGAAEPKGLAETLSENPFLKFHNAERGYVCCEVTPGQWRSHYRTVPFVTRRGAPLQTRASFIVESGRPVLHRA